MDILRLGVLQARAAGWSGDAESAAAAADHIHNLPGLLNDYTPRGLDYYWTAERPAFLARCPADWAQQFQPHWDRLQRQAECLNKSSAAHESDNVASAVPLR